MNVKLWE